MSVSLLQSIGGWLTTSGLTAGYGLKYFRYTAEDLNSPPFILIRKSGNGIMNTVIQNIDFSIAIVCDAAGQVVASNKLNEIERLIRGVDYPAGVTQMKTLMSATDPRPMENGLFYLYLEMRVTVENY